MKKINTLIVCFALLLSMMAISTPALAVDLASNPWHPTVGSTAKAPRSFSKSYEDVALTSRTLVLMSDSNWWNERTVTVTIDQLSENATVTFACYTRKSSEDTWEHFDTSSPLSFKNPSAKFDLPNNVQFQIRVWASEKCNADIIVSLA